MLTIAYILISFQLVVLATPVDREYKGDSRVWLTKRANIPDPVGDVVVSVTDLLFLLLNIGRKYHNGFEAYHKNTGGPHPLFEGYEPPQTPNITRRATGSDPLSDENNGLLWKGSITVGTPPQAYTVDFDTGSSDLFLPGPKCGSSCSGHKLYNPTSSSTSADRGKSFALAYGDGSSVRGEEYTDNISMAGLNATRQALGAASIYSSGFSSSRFSPDGLFGMGYQSISQYNSPPPFQTLVAQRQTSKPVFAFKLAKTGSELFLGGIDSDLYTGAITYTPVTVQGYWQVLMNAVSVYGNTAVTNIPAIIDTGTTLIIGDNASVRALYQRIPGSKDASKVIGPGFYTFPCNAIPNVSMTFGGRVFPILPNLFNLGRVSSGSSDCVGAIVGQQQRFWIVGDIFLQGVYSVFDLGSNQVGFATLKM